MPILETCSSTKNILQKSKWILLGYFFLVRTNGSIIILEHNGSGTIGLKLIMEPLVLTINSNCHYNLEEKKYQIF